VICGIDSCAVIVEDLSDKIPRKKKDKSKKRTIKKADMITNPEELKLLHERSMAFKDVNVKKEKKTLGERIREKWHGTLYNKNDE
jgi:hypothetical protein